MMYDFTKEPQRKLKPVQFNKIAHSVFAIAFSLGCGAGVFNYKLTFLSGFLLGALLINALYWVLSIWLADKK